MEPSLTKSGTLLAIRRELYSTTKSITQKEKKTLSIVFGVERFHEYLYLYLQIYRNQWSQTIEVNFQ